MPKRTNLSTNAVCSVEGCDRPYRAKGLCGLHYSRNVRHGDPLMHPHLRWPENLLARMEPQSNGCIHWTGMPCASGYGRVSANGKHMYTHRAAYEHFVGPIPPGMTIDHECHNLSGCTITDHTCPHRRCVNPEHLVPKPIGENTLASPNTVPGRHARQTHCVNGHEFTEENTAVRRNGNRRCRQCQRDRRAAKRHEREEKGLT